MWGAAGRGAADAAGCGWRLRRRATPTSHSGCLPAHIPHVCLQRLKGEVDLENYENVPVPRPKQLPDDDE